jgi:hypothetical protein
MKTRATYTTTPSTNWFYIQAGVGTSDYSVSSGAAGTILMIQSNRTIQSFEINLGMNSLFTITPEDTAKYGFVWISEEQRYVQILEEEFGQENNIYIQCIDGILYLSDNYYGMAVKNNILQCKIYFSDGDNIECGYCRIDELATMLGFSSVKVINNQNDEFNLDEPLYVEIYKTTSGKYTTLCGYTDTNPSNKPLLQSGFRFMLHTIDALSINMDFILNLNAEPTPQKREFKITDSLILNSAYYYCFEKAFYNKNRQLSYNNITIQNSNDLLTLLESYGAILQNKNEWNYDSYSKK